MKRIHVISFYLMMELKPKHPQNNKVAGPDFIWSNSEADRMQTIKISV